MLPALIYGVVNALFVYVLVAICYSITIIVSIKSNIISKENRKRFIKHIAIMHAIYFIPIVLIGMLKVLEFYITGIILAIILMLATYPISKLVLREKNKKE